MADTSRKPLLIEECLARRFVLAASGIQNAHEIRARGIGAEISNAGRQHGDGLP